MSPISSPDGLPPPARPANSPVDGSAASPGGGPPRPRPETDPTEPGEP
ncbi:NYN domain-containing protein, partial [Micromonospora arida]